MKKLLYIMLLLVFSCNTKKAVEEKKINFEYISSNKNRITMDSEEYSDVRYKILVPSKIIKTVSTTGIGFQNKIYFNNNQIIVTLYSPDKEYKPFNNIYNCSYLDFNRFLASSNLQSFFDDVKFISKRKYSVRRFNNNFLIFSINIVEKNQNEFENSINSLSVIN